MLSSGALSLDVWIEVIRHFRLNIADEVVTQRTKNAVLGTLSLVSRQLYPLAQSEMWRTVSSAKHIARYIVSAEGSNIVNTMHGKASQPPNMSTIPDHVSAIVLAQAT